jgi:hypothetical protein
MRSWMRIIVVRMDGMKLHKGLVWLSVIAGSVLFADLPKLEPLGPELEVNRVILVRLSPMLLKVREVRRLSPPLQRKDLSLPNFKGMAQMEGVNQVEMSPVMRSITGDAPELPYQTGPVWKPVLTGPMRVDERMRSFRPAKGEVSLMEVPWWISTESVWSGGPVGSLRARVAEEESLGSEQRVAELKQQYWLLYQRALERRKVFLESESSIGGRAVRE